MACRSRALRRDILAVLNRSHYRQASRRVATDMSAAPGFAGVAEIVDRLAANPTRSAPENTVTPR
jgi:UDP:flavonoid glycosyltransferase YjiC (YdhE family)